MPSKIALVFVYHLRNGAKISPLFNLWLKTAEKNETIDFFIVSNKEMLTALPPLTKNIHPIEMTFDQYIERLRKITGLNVDGANPYKASQYRAAIGLTFSEYLHDYDWWGYGDNDVIYGDIRKFLSEEKLSSFDKIYCFGHLTLVKNTSDNNKMFLGKVSEEDKRYPASVVFTKNILTFFDEGPFTRIFIANGKKVYTNNNDFFDISFSSFNFVSSHEAAFQKPPYYFIWKEGKLFAISAVSKNEQPVEICYAHFQKRKMDIDATSFSSDEIVAVPNKIAPLTSMTNKEIIECSTMKNMQWENEQRKAQKRFEKKNRISKLKVLLSRFLFKK